MPQQESELIQKNRLESSGKFGEGPTTHIYNDLGYGRTHHVCLKKETWQWDQRFYRSGGYGLVWKVTTAEQMGAPGQNLRAVKQISKATRNVKSQVKYSRELEAAFTFSDDRFAPYFVRSYGWFEDTEDVFLAMEYLECGDLGRFISKSLPEPDVRCITSQLVKGLAFMHQNGFTHRDIKPANVLVVQPQPHWKVKIGDFGISKFANQCTHLKTKVGTLNYMAPEILEDGFAYTSAVDMWSLGITVYEMLAEESNIPAHTEFVVQRALSGLEVSKDCKSFLEELLRDSPGERMRSEVATSRPWLRSEHIANSRTALVKGTSITSPPTCNESLNCEHLHSKPSTVPKSRSPRQDSPAEKTPLNPDIQSGGTGEDRTYTVTLMSQKERILTLSLKSDEWYDQLGFELTRKGRLHDGDGLKLSYIDMNDKVRKALNEDDDLARALGQSNEIRLYLEEPEQSSRPDPSAPAQEKEKKSSTNNSPSPGQIEQHVVPSAKVGWKSTSQGPKRIVASPEVRSQESRKHNQVATQPWSDSRDLLSIKRKASEARCRHGVDPQPMSSMVVNVSRPSRHGTLRRERRHETPGGERRHKTPRRERRCEPPVGGEGGRQETPVGERIHETPRRARRLMHAMWPPSWRR